MAKRILNIVETAYRATIEEQDDPVVWIAHAMKGAGADVAVLLRGNAVSYAVKAQDASGLWFGGRAQTQPPRIAEDVQKLTDKGVSVFVVRDDLAERGIVGNETIRDVQLVDRSAIAGLFGGYDLVWHW